MRRPPSSNLQLRLDLVDPDALVMNDDTPAFVLHVVSGGQLISHVQPVAVV